MQGQVHHLGVGRVSLGVSAAHAAVRRSVTTSIAAIVAVARATYRPTTDRPCASTAATAVRDVYGRTVSVRGIGMHRTGGYELGGMVDVVAEALVRVAVGMRVGVRMGGRSGGGIVGSVTSGGWLVVPGKSTVGVVMRQRVGMRVGVAVRIVVVRHVVADHIRRMHGMRMSRHAGCPAAPHRTATCDRSAADGTAHVARGRGHRVVAVVVVVVVGHRRKLRIQAVAHGHGALDVMRGMGVAHEEGAHGWWSRRSCCTKGTLLFPILGLFLFYFHNSAWALSLDSHIFCGFCFWNSNYCEQLSMIWDLAC